MSGSVFNDCEESQSVRLNSRGLSVDGIALWSFQRNAPPRCRTRWQTNVSTKRIALIKRSISTWVFEVQKVVDLTFDVRTLWWQAVSVRLFELLCSCRSEMKSDLQQNQYSRVLKTLNPFLRWQSCQSSKLQKLYLRLHYLRAKGRKPSPWCQGYAFMIASMRRLAVCKVSPL